MAPSAEAEGANPNEGARMRDELITVPWRPGQSVREFLAACRQALDDADAFHPHGHDERPVDLPHVHVAAADWDEQRGG